MKYWLDKILLCATVVWLVVAKEKVRVVPITLQNMKQQMGCYALDPVNCSPNEPWVLLFYNSTEPSQTSKVDYLIQLYIKQLAFVSSFSKEKVFVWPQFAIIDCFYSSNLCRSLCQTDLPLVLFNDPGEDSIKYEGYITLAGLISFIKTHDPLTSKLAQFYNPDCENYIQSPTGLSHKQIKKMANKWKNKMNRLIKSAYFYSNSQVILPDENESSQQVQETNEKDRETKQSESTISHSSQNRNVEASDAHEQQVYAQQQKHRDEKESENVSQPKGSKKQQNGFFSLVRDASGWVKDVFKQLGFSGVLLDLIEWVSYIFFFCLFGILALLL